MDWTCQYLEVIEIIKSLILSDLFTVTMMALPCDSDSGDGRDGDDRGKREEKIRLLLVGKPRLFLIS